MPPTIPSLLSLGVVFFFFICHQCPLIFASYQWIFFSKKSNTSHWASQRNMNIVLKCLYLWIMIQKSWMNQRHHRIPDHLIYFELKIFYFFVSDSIWLFFFFFIFRCKQSKQKTIIRNSMRTREKNPVEKRLHGWCWMLV